MVESCKQVRPWRYAVTQAAIAANQPLITGPVGMSVVFLFPRPAGHFRRDGTLKPSAPKHHSTRPDGSKLLRSTEDALTSVCYTDDARIVSSTFLKRYCIGQELPGAIITIIPWAT